MLSLAELTARTAHTGSVVWLGIRPGRHAEVRSLPSVWIGPGGLQGDHRARPGKRAVSLIQAEHLTVISALSGAPEVTFEMLRRNIAVSGLNLAAMRGRSVRIGTCELSIAGICAPCSRMESALGHGGYTAVRGHGGMVAEVSVPGLIRQGDTVVPLDTQALS